MSIIAFEKRGIVDPRIREVKAPATLQRAFRIQNCPQKGLLIIVSVRKEADDCTWLHVSFSRKSNTPDYQDIVFVRENFIGEDRKAIMVFPKKEEYVNIHEVEAGSVVLRRSTFDPNCLHLWCNLTKDQLPDFRVAGAI